VGRDLVGKPLTGLAAMRLGWYNLISVVERFLTERNVRMATEASTRPTEYAHIVHTPGMLGGEARIEGHRIRVRDVMAARDRGGLTPEEIASTVYPSLTLAEVYAALAYYEDHREEINRAFEEEARVVEEFRREHPKLVRDFASHKD
jgi:uncharacterized protein (DUF433 family)